MNMTDHVDKNRSLLTRLGSKWGGLHLDLGLIPENSLVVSAGLSNDISFDRELIERKGCRVIGIDPTFVSKRTVLKYHLLHPARRKHFTLLRRAVHAKSGLTVRLGGPARTFLSPSGTKARTISLDDLVLTYGGASVLKLDIEGAEFPAIEALQTRLRVPQIAIGFHCWLNSDSDRYPNEGVPPGLYSAGDVLAAVAKIKGMGYKLVFEEREEPERVGQETLFIREEFASGYRDIELG